MDCCNRRYLCNNIQKYLIDVENDSGTGYNKRNFEHNIQKYLLGGSVWIGRLEEIII